MSLDFRKQITASIPSAIIGSIILFFLGLIGQFVSEGGLIQLLGGVSKAELISYIPTPRGAVVAFDSDLENRQCPKGWVAFSAGEGRMIVGVSSTHQYREMGGSERVTLDASHMPEHKHEYLDIYYSENSRINTDYDRKIEVPRGLGSMSSDTDNFGLALERATELSGQSQPNSNENMPPYIALYFCKKE